MKQKFSKHWKASKQPRKQRKYVAKAPLHIKRKLLSINLSKELRKKYSRRNIPAKKNDVVKIMVGKFKNKHGKIIEVDVRNSRLKIDGITVKKRDGSSVNVKIHPSNLQITELNLEDKKRMKQSNKEESKKEKTEKKIEKAKEDKK